jgi:hypothetical protein
VSERRCWVSREVSGVGSYRRGGVGSAARYQVLARIGEEVLGEFWAGILVQFLRSILDRFLGDSRTRFACIPGFSGCRRLIWTDFQTSFDTFISDALGPDVTKQLLLDPYL